jgi:2-aminoadipate transaminase
MGNLQTATTIRSSKTLWLSRGVPPAESIPITDLAEIARSVAAEIPDVFQYASFGGFLGNEQLRQHLGTFHGVDPVEIFVGSGSLQVLDLLAEVLLRAKQRTVLVERPTYDRSIKIFERRGARVIGIPLERDGLDLDALAAVAKRQSPAFLYVIPDFQNPSGVTTSQRKRERILELAAEYDFLVIEDIPYRELRTTGRAPEMIGKMSGRGRVVTIGSLSKILSPGLRVGYAICNPNLARQLALLAEDTYLSPSPLTQAIAAQCFKEGLVNRNIESIRTQLRPRVEGAVQIAKQLLGSRLCSAPEGGYFLACLLPSTNNEASVLSQARAAGLMLTSGSAFFVADEQPTQNQLFFRLPFHALAIEDFAAGLTTLLAIVSPDDDRPQPATTPLGSAISCRIQA